MLLIGRKLTSATKRLALSFQLDEIEDTADEIEDTADEIEDTADEIEDTAVPCPLYVKNSLVEDNEKVYLLRSGEAGVSLRP